MSGIMNKLGLGHKDHSADHHDSTGHHSTTDRHSATTTSTTTTSNNAGLLNNQAGINSGLNQTTTAPYGTSTATSTTRSGAAYSNTGVASSGVASSGVASTGIASNQYNQVGRVSGEDAMTRSEEQLRVAKQTVETGKAELNKTVETVHVEQAVPIAKERVVIEREPITNSNLPAAMSGPQISEAHYETTLREDRVAATKETVPIERIRLAKQTETSVESVGADLRKEHVDLTMHSMDNAKTDIGRSNLHGDKIDTLGRSGLAHDNSKFDTTSRSGLAHDNTSLHSSNIGTTTGSGLHGSSLHGNSGLNSGLNNSSLHSSSNTRNI